MLMDRQDPRMEGSLRTDERCNSPPGRMPSVAGAPAILSSGIATRSRPWPLQQRIAMYKWLQNNDDHGNQNYAAAAYHKQTEREADIRFWKYLGAPLHDAQAKSWNSL